MRLRRTEPIGGIGRDKCTVHLVSREEVSEGATCGSVGLYLESDGERRTGIRGFLPSLVLSGPRQTLPVWSPMVRSRRGSDGLISA